MKRPVLVIMAAGVGRRYGGPKQMDPVDEQGQILIDYSVFDALSAGFREVIFVLKRGQEAEFKETVGARLSRFIKVSYVAQELNDLPEGFEVPNGRVKEWGTAHAVLSCIYILNEAPFVVINGDAYYDKRVLHLAYDYLVGQVDDDDKYHYAKANKGMLWAFTNSVLDELQSRFPLFLEQAKKDPLQAEYLIRDVINELLQEDKADVQLLDADKSSDGITCQKDWLKICESIHEMQEKGLYPKSLWRNNKHIRTL